MLLNDLMSLTGRTAVITGATGYLGSMMAEVLASMGADLILTDRAQSELESLAQRIKSQYFNEINVYELDLEDTKSIDTFICDIKENHKYLNILINNAAFAGGESLSGWSVPFHEQSVSSWVRALNVNMTSVFHLCKELTPLLEIPGNGSIINISSIYGVYGPDWRLYEETTMSNPAAYAASKGGLIQFSRWLATTISPNVRVNCVSPGGVFRNQPDIFVKKYIDKTPLKRMATEQDFAGVIAFLSSDMSAYVTGQNILVDGGWGIW